MKGYQHTAEDLIWSLDEARDLVKTHAVWPAFIGNRVALEAKGGKGEDLNQESIDAGEMKALLWTLPAIIWPEQRKFVYNNRRNKQKRKRADNIHRDDSSDVEGQNEDKPVTKKQRTSTFDFRNGLISSIYNGVLGLSRRLVGMYYPSQPSTTTTAKEQTAVLEEKALDSEDYTANEAVVMSAPTTNSSEIGGTGIIDSEVEKEAIPFQEVVYNKIRAHQSNYVVTGGDVYGGEYSLYKGGDPSTTHSVATVRIQETNKINVRDLIAFSRVQNQVAKSAVIAFPTQNEGGKSETQFLTFQFRRVKGH